MEEQRTPIPDENRRGVHRVFEEALDQVKVRFVDEVLRPHLVTGEPDSKAVRIRRVNEPVRG